MGIAGHILGPRKLRKLCRLTGVTFNRAYNHNGYCEAVVWLDEGCEHYLIDRDTHIATPFTPRCHWTSCTDRESV